MSMLVSLRRRRFGAGLAAAALAGALALPAQAQSERAPVRILVGFAAGGTIDLVARVLAEHLQQDLGAPVIVDSRPGAGGQIAARALKQAAPDGRTLMLAPDHTMVMVPLTSKTPGFELADFAPIGQVARYAGGFAVTDKVQATKLDEFFTWAKAHPGQASVGIPAPGSIPQFFIHLLSQQTKTPLTSVPYRGSAPLVQDMMGGQIAAGTTALGDFIEPQQAGKLRVIAVLGQQRSSALPDVPTFTEQGYKIDWEYWLGLFAPAKTPSAEVQRINAGLKRVLALPDVRERLHKIVFEPAYGTPEELATLVRAGTALWEPAVTSSGWVPQ